MEFQVVLRSFEEIRAFVSLASVQPFPVTIGNERQEVSAKSFIGMFSLDYSRPLQVRADCGEDAFRRFRQAAAGFAVK